MCRFLGRRAPNTFEGSFHMSLGCRWAGYETFSHCHCAQVRCSLDEACVDCFEYRLELYTDSVFSVGIRSVFLGITNTNTEGKFGRYFRYQKFGGSPSKNWREPPFFLRRGGAGPLFVHFTLLLKKKRNSPGIFQKRVPAKS
jgi:hypothetical protein